ncbi:hypothetical protein DFH07DRAFT_884988 [Mycena maculata]|uniref:BTB domain-containing protein n=1 Tax=Mycena maculata TaxID=230809 RepID=A0AAD7J9A0_9AGAR|nr:hypothetical protein DFH07DRAFT_884988 [Mycena maculata]
MDQSFETPIFHDYSRQGPPVDQCHRVDELWFADGTLVLAAEKSLFRVYGGLLAKRSAVFQDMLEFSQPEDAEAIDGCPVVHLADSDEDLKYFLRALFDYESFEPLRTKTTFDILAGIIRLSSKYQVDGLRQRALYRLSSVFPLTVAEYCDNTDESWTIPAAEWIRVVCFAREMTLDWILPIAMYRTSGYCTTAQLLHGIEVKETHVELSAEDKLKCIEQSQSICRSVSEIVDFLWNPVKIQGCLQETICTENRVRARRMVEGWRIKKKWFPVKVWHTQNWKTLAVCTVCSASMKVTHQRALEKFWNGLPRRFGLPDWDALKQMKENDLRL